MWALVGPKVAPLVIELRRLLDGRGSSVVSLPPRRQLECYNFAPSNHSALGSERIDFSLLSAGPGRDLGEGRDGARATIGRRRAGRKVAGDWAGGRAASTWPAGWRRESVELKWE